MLTRQKIKLQQGTSTDQTSGQVTTKQYQRRKTEFGRKQRRYQPYHLSVAKTKKMCNNLTENNEEEKIKSKPRQQTQRKLSKKKQVKKIDSDVDLGDLKTIDTTVVSEANPGTWGVRLAVVNDKTAWFGQCFSSTISLINTKGHIIQKFNLNLIPIDISVNSNNDLIFSEFKGRYICKFTNKKEQIIADLYPYKTRGLCWTSDNEILVCLEKLGKKAFINKVVRISLEGKIVQTIQKDKNNKYIFTDAALIAENVNKDICVVDNYNSLIVLYKDGDVKFKFLHTSDTASRIFRGVYGIACDSLGCIILSDPDDSCLHMISGAGQYLQKVLTEPFGIEKPWGIGTDIKNQLWIIDNSDGKFKIIKYRS